VIFLVLDRLKCSLGGEALAKLLKLGLLLVFG
jgi:hypothetical protein